jgi:hypothetical protein
MLGASHLNMKKDGEEAGSNRHGIFLCVVHFSSHLFCHFISFPSHTIILLQQKLQNTCEKLGTKHKKALHPMIESQHE